MSEGEEWETHLKAELLIDQLRETWVSQQLATKLEGDQSEVADRWAERIWDLLREAPRTVVERAVLMALEPSMLKVSNRAAKWWDNFLTNP